MDKAEARARRYVSVDEIFSELEETLESPEPSIAKFLLHPIELHKLDFHCQCRIEDDTDQSLTVELFGHDAKEFLIAVASGDDDLKSIEYHFKLHFQKDDDDDSPGYWEILHPELLAVLENPGDEYSGTIPFSQFLVSKVELKSCFRDTNNQIPSRWVNGDAPLDEVKATPIIVEHPPPLLNFYEDDGVFHVGLEGVSEVRKWTDFPLGFYDIRNFFALDGKSVWVWRYHDLLIETTPEALASGDRMASEYQPSDDGGPSPKPYRFHDDGVANDNVISSRKDFRRTCKLLDESKAELLDALESGADDGVIAELTSNRDVTQKYINQAKGYFGAPNSALTPPYILKKEHVRSRVNKAIEALNREKQHDIAKYIYDTIKVRNWTKYEAPEENHWRILTEP